MYFSIFNKYFQYSSQRDMFESQGSPLSQSILQMDGNVSTHTTEYTNLLFFDWAVDNRRPFEIFPRTLFSDKEIKERWLNSILDENSRIMTLPPLKSLPGKTFSLFGKIEKGI